MELKPVPSRDLVLPVYPQEDNARGGALVIQLKNCLRARFAQMNGQTVKSDHVYPTVQKYMSEIHQFL